MVKCRYCRRDIPYNSVFCNWCGGRQILEKNVISVPQPKQLKNGCFSAQVRVGKDRITVTEPTEEEYFAKARALKSGQIKISATITLAEAIDKYAVEKDNRLSPTTKDNYQYIKNNRFQSLMGKRICDITERDLDRAIEIELGKQSRKGGFIKPKTVNDAMTLVISVISHYTDTNLKADAVKEVKNIKDYPTVEEVVNAILGTDIELPCLLALWLGMSMEEIRGLTKSKSMIGDKICIVETVVDTSKGQIRKQGGKAKDRVRSYQLPLYIKELIDNVDDDVIEKRSAHAIYMRLQRVLKDNNVKVCSFHDLRHLNTATMTSANIPSKTIQSRNGWSSDRMIKQVYDYVYDADRQKADSFMDNYFNQLIKKST